MWKTIVGYAALFTGAGAAGYFLIDTIQPPCCQTSIYTPTPCLMVTLTNDSHHRIRSIHLLENGQPLDSPRGLSLPPNSTLYTPNELGVLTPPREFRDETILELSPVQFSLGPWASATIGYMRANSWEAEITYDTLLRTKTIRVPLFKDHRR